jgi:hypothetical protein
MKCPHCGMNIRDNILTCGYCGEDIPQRPDKLSDNAGNTQSAGGGAAQKGAKPTKTLADEPDMEEEEEGGGLSPYLQSGEQVLIGSLNVSVKKFFFHAYMTNRRIFLIDTQEKKLKVTAKDVPRDTIAGSIIEFSESSDPVLVLSIRSTDDEIKTMKIVFVQNGLDRSSEIEEWISLLHEGEQPKKPLKHTTREPKESVEEPEPVVQEKPLPKPELHPAKKPAKDHEKQPPVKRLISPYKTPEKEPEPESIHPPRRAQIRQIPEPLERSTETQEYDRELPPKRDDIPHVRKPEVQSAMKVAMKSAMKPLSQPPARQIRRDVPDRVIRRPVVESESEEKAPSPKRLQIQENVQEKPAHEEVADVPQFCHNCGKKLPLEANFCPGCGTRLGQNRTLTGARFPGSHHQKKTLPSDTITAEKKASPPPRTEEPDEDEIEDERPQPTKPPLKKAPKGSEMTILHKFLRR